MTVAIFLLVLGLGIVGIALAGESSARARSRRLDALKARHGAGDVVETQLRRVTASRLSKLDTGFHRLVPNPQLLQRRLDATGKDWSIGAFGLIAAGLVSVAWLVLWLRGLNPIIVVCGGLVIGAGIPHWYVGRMGQKRKLRFTIRFPDAIELLVRGLRSGLPVSETIGVIANELPDPVGTEFRAVNDKMKIGKTMEAALQDSADRLQLSEFQFFVISLAIQRETGGNLAETLSNLSNVLRQRMQMKLKVKAMSSESKASAYIIGALPFIVFVMIYYINPEYMGTFFSDSRLKIAAAGGAIWMSIGAFIMAKMINFEI